MLAGEGRTRQKECTQEKEEKQRGEPAGGVPRLTVNMAGVGDSGQRNVNLMKRASEWGKRASPLFFLLAHGFHNTMHVSPQSCDRCPGSYIQYLSIHCKMVIPPPRPPVFI